MTRVISRSRPLFQSTRVQLRFARTQIIRFSSSSLFAKLKNTVRVRLRFDKNSVKPVYKTPVRVRFDSLRVTRFVAMKDLIGDETKIFSGKSLNPRLVNVESMM